MLRSLRALAALSLVLLPAIPDAAAQDPQEPRAALDWLQRADGARVVPDRFLRRWDPITVFFDHDAGPAGGAPEDDAGRLVRLDPLQPGAWTWLGARALQFRPAEGWQPLRRVRLLHEGRETELVPLLGTPREVGPSEERSGTVDLDSFALTFDGPVEVAALNRLLTIEVRPQPGIDGTSGQFLSVRDWDIKTVERQDRGAAQTYIVALKQPIGDGRVAILRLRLADDPGLDAPLFEMRRQSAVPFRIAQISCALRNTAQRGDATYCTIGRGESRRRGLTLAMTATPAPLNAVAVREAFRVTPPVDDLTVEPAGEGMLRLFGTFGADTLYSLEIAAGALRDTRGRPLAAAFPTTRFAFEAEEPRLGWDASQGIVERYGPQMVPLRGRGYDRADVRIHPVDPLSRELWPFPTSPVETDDDAKPPLPGNEPRPWVDAYHIGRQDIAARLKALGSPAVSELVTLPLQRGGGEAKFGLDLKPLLARIAGPDQPGTYLVGIRAVDGGKRRWAYLQVTDLVLAAVEEREAVRFVVTSLATAAPVPDAELRIESTSGYGTLVTGQTGPDGSFTWAVDGGMGRIVRIVVAKGDDTLVLIPDRAPPSYNGETWQAQDRGGWLSGVFARLRQAEPAETRCHIFTDRPIYRPEEPVHIKGMLRQIARGDYDYGRSPAKITVTGPNDQEWSFPADVDEVGGFYHLFDEKTDATGQYKVTLDDRCDARFLKEAYRLPTFEVLLTAPPQVPLDAPFEVDMAARYFAGGLLANRPVKWRVTQFPQVWTPPRRDGFLFSSDARFSGDGRFTTTPVLERDSRTDAGGGARLPLDPTVEPTAQPRRYVVEATVTGDDDIQVRNTINVVALPPFVLGIKVPRYLPRLGAIEPEVVATDADGAPVPGIAMKARLIRRSWSSMLQASDFSQGSAKYVTEVIDETVAERAITSGSDVDKLSFDAAEAGVYLVELTAEDKMGRRQSVTVDLFMAGDTPVTWSRPPARTVTVTADKEAYVPGERATLILQSPFQTARALAVVEEPEGPFRYDWIDIANGTGRYEVEIRKPQMPRLAVHFLLSRGRVQGTAPGPTAPFDLGKPATVAASAWLNVTPVKHRVQVAFDAPARAQPAEEVEVILRLTDDTGAPVAGEAAFWMVDQAVLSLAREKPLDPLPNFIVQRPARIVARDTRNMAFGILPLEEVPGGDEAADEWGLADNISVRKNFTPVPVFLPRVQTGTDGVARIKVKLPDTLTVYKLRAKAIAGPDRFGFGTGEMLIRQPVVAQPVLPRFLRSGDRFEAGLLGRIVEGPGGSGRAAISGNGFTLEGGRDRSFAWAQNEPARLAFAAVAAEARPGAEHAQVRFLLQREADRAADAVQIDLPILPDRLPLRRRSIQELAPAARLEVAPPSEPARPGTYIRAVALAADPGLARMIGALSYLVDYPYGCTEQRIALAASALAFKPFEPILDAAGIGNQVSTHVRSALRAIEATIDDDGLVAFWPRSRGTVTLTAWAYALATAADKAGEPVDKALRERLAKTLTNALRSDYPRLLSGEDLRERMEALSALAQADKPDPAYTAELARRAALMPTVSLAQAVSTVARLENADRRLLAELADTLWGRVRLVQRNGQAAYGGLADERPGNPVILPSETRTLAEITRALARTGTAAARLETVRAALLRLGGSDGWGSTNANTAALQALADVWSAPRAALPVALTLPTGTETLVLDESLPAVRRATSEATTLRLENLGREPVLALVDTRFVPAERGDRATAEANGFVVTRSLARIAAGAPPERLQPGADGAIRLSVGDVVEEVLELVNPEDRTHVAIRLPGAAGLEPLNPSLATAPAEAAPSASPTLAPTWAAYRDAEVMFVYERLPRGNYRFAVRSRATFPGSYTQPPAEAETMYQPGIAGSTDGRRIVVAR